VRRTTYWPYIIVAYLSLAGLGLLDNSRGPFYPDLSASLELNESRAALFFALASFVALCSSYLCKFLVKKVSVLWGLRFSTFIMSLGYFLFSKAKNFTELMI